MEHGAAGSEMALSSAEGLGHLVPKVQSLPGMQRGSNPARAGQRRIGMGCLQGGAGAVPGRGAWHRWGCLHGEVGLVGGSWHWPSLPACHKVGLGRGEVVGERQFGAAS